MLLNLINFRRYIFISTIIISLLLLCSPRSALAIKWKITASSKFEIDNGFFFPRHINSKGDLVGAYFPPPKEGYKTRLAYWTKESGLVIIQEPDYELADDFDIALKPKVLISNNRKIFALISYTSEDNHFPMQDRYLYEYDINLKSGQLHPIVLPDDINIPESKHEHIKYGAIYLIDFNSNKTQLFSFQADYKLKNNNIPIYNYSNGAVKPYKTNVDYRTEVRLFETNDWYYGPINGLDGQGIHNAGAHCPFNKRKCSLLPIQRFKGWVYSSTFSSVLFGTLNDLNTKTWYMPVRWINDQATGWRYQFIDIGSRIRRFTIDKNSLSGSIEANVVNKKGWVGGSHSGSLNNYSGPFLFMPIKGASPHIGALKPVDLSSQFRRYAKNTLGLRGGWNTPTIYAMSECGSFLFKVQRRGRTFYFVFEPEIQECS